MADMQPILQKSFGFLNSEVKLPRNKNLRIFENGLRGER